MQLFGPCTIWFAAKLHITFAPIVQRTKQLTVATLKSHVLNLFNKSTACFVSVYVTNFKLTNHQMFILTICPSSWPGKDVIP